MVSGFLTSPRDHSRIFSGEARPIRIASKLFNSNMLCHLLYVIVFVKQIITVIRRKQFVHGILIQFIRIVEIIQL